MVPDLVPLPLVRAPDHLSLGDYPFGRLEPVPRTGSMPPKNREGPGFRGPRRRMQARSAPGYCPSSTSSKVPMPEIVIPTVLVPFGGALKVARRVFTSP
jgi:hypothetical protein